MNRQELITKAKTVVMSPVRLVRWLGTGLNSFFEDNPFSFTRTLLVIYTAMVGFVIWFIYSAVNSIVGKITVVDENAASVVDSITLLLGAILTALGVLAGMYQKMKGVKSKDEECDEDDEDDIHKKYEK